MENLTEVEKLYIRLLEARVDKLWYFYDTDEFINTSFDILDLCNIEDCLILGPPDRLAGSRVKLEPLLEELEEQKDELDARKILFPNLPVDCWRGDEQNIIWTPAKLIGGGLQGSIWVVCDDFSCDFIAKIPSGFVSSEGEAEFHKRASDLDVAPIFEDSIDCEFQGDDITVIITERFEGDLAFVLSNEPDLNKEQLENIVNQCLELIWILLSNDIAHRDTKTCNFVFIKDNGDFFIRLTDYGISQELTADIKKAMIGHTNFFIRSYMKPEEACQNNPIEDERKDMLLKATAKVILDHPEWDIDPLSLFFMSESDLPEFDPFLQRDDIPFFPPLF